MARVIKEQEHAERRNEILDVAQKLVYTRGYEQMSIQDILDALGISKGAFYHYFDSKQALLEALTGVPWERRSARFRCVVAMVSPDGVWETAEGVCEGAIAFEPAGDGGFGYDPVFFLPEYGCTMAQLPPETKNRISHRARAIRAALPVLERLACRR